MPSSACISSSNISGRRNKKVFTIVDEAHLLKRKTLEEMERKCNGGLTINARIETLWERPMFSYSIHSQRCILPASHFYEWDLEKQKTTFYSAEGDFLFLAGIYSTYNGIDRFVIITKPADEVILPIHERMPVCIPLSLLQDWLYDNTATKKILATATIPLVREQNIQQLSLWQ